MDARIAVLLDENSNVAGPGGCAMLAVFEKIGGAWTVVREIPADIRLDGGLYAARNEILSLPKALTAAGLSPGRNSPVSFLTRSTGLAFLSLKSRRFPRTSSTRCSPTSGRRRPKSRRTPPSKRRAGPLVSGFDRTAAQRPRHVVEKSPAPHPRRAVFCGTDADLQPCAALA